MAGGRKTLKPINSQDLFGSLEKRNPTASIGDANRQLGEKRKKFAQRLDSKVREKKNNGEKIIFVGKRRVHEGRQKKKSVSGKEGTPEDKTGCEVREKIKELWGK